MLIQKINFLDMCADCVSVQTTSSSRAAPTTALCGCGKSVDWREKPLPTARSLSSTNTVSLHCSPAFLLFVFARLVVCVCLSTCLCVCLPVCLSPCMSVSLSEHNSFFACQSVCVYGFLPSCVGLYFQFFCLPICCFVCQSVCLNVTVFLFLCLPFCLLVCLLVCLPVCLTRCLLWEIRDGWCSRYQQIFIFICWVNGLFCFDGGGHKGCLSVKIVSS